MREESAAPSRVGLRALARRGWVIVLAVAAVGAIAWAVAQSRPPSYDAEAVVQVPSGAGAGDPGDAGSASALARTYAASVPKDEAIAALAGKATGLDPADVYGHMSVFNDQDTAVLHLKFTADSGERAVAGARAMSDAISGPHPVTAGVPAGSVVAIQQPTDASRSSTLSPTTATAVGAVLGLAIGLVLLIGWERADPRVDRQGDIGSELGVPVAELDRLSPGSIAVLLERWQQSALVAHVGVALVPAHRKLRSAVAEIAQHLAQVGRAEGIGVDVSRGGDVAAAPLTLVPTEPVGMGPGVGREIGDCDLVVLVVRRGQRLSKLRDVSAAMWALGLRADWALLTGGRPSRRLPHRRAGATAPTGGELRPAR